MVNHIRLIILQDFLTNSCCCWQRKLYSLHSSMFIHLHPHFIFIILVTTATSFLLTPCLFSSNPFIYKSQAPVSYFRLTHCNSSDICTQQLYPLYNYFAFKCSYYSLPTTNYQIIYSTTFIEPCTPYKYYWMLSFSWVCLCIHLATTTNITRVYIVVLIWQGRTATQTTACQMSGASTTTRVAVRTKLRAPGYPPAWQQPPVRGAEAPVEGTRVRRSTDETAQHSRRTNCTSWREPSRSRTIQTCTVVRSSPWRWTCPRCAYR